MGDIAERLKWVRSVTGLSQKRFASGAGLRSDGPIRHLESGLTETIETASAVAVCSYVGCSLGWLLTGEGSPPSEEKLRSLSASGASE